jgi:hypothetical protein
MILLLKSNKALVVTKETKIYQKESLVDNMVIYVPETYNDYDLKLFTATLFYTNSANVAYSELLTAEEETEKEGFITYKLPVNTKLTKVAGDVTMYLSLVWTDEETEQTHVLKSSELTINIAKWNDYFKYIDDDSLTVMDNKIAQMQTMVDEIRAVAETYDGSVPNDLALSDEGLLQLSIDGETTGSGVSIVTSGSQDGDSNPSDAVVDLGGVNP